MNGQLLLKFTIPNFPPKMAFRPKKAKPAPVLVLVMNREAITTLKSNAGCDLTDSAFRRLVKFHSHIIEYMRSARFGEKFIQDFETAALLFRSSLGFERSTKRNDELIALHEKLERTILSRTF